MFTKTEDKYSQKIDSYAVTISINPVQKLQKLTEQELAKLQVSKRNMESVHSNLDLLIKRYNLEKSYFGQIANWYGSKAWWIKIILFVLIAGIGAAIGMLVNMPITIVLVTSALYIFFAFFFINHHHITEQQTKRLCEDIIELEKSLTETINHFNEISNSLKDITKNMHELNSQFLIDMQSMKINVAELTEQLAKYKEIINELRAAQNTLISCTSQTQSDLEIGREKYSECGAIISQQSAEISAICSDLGASNRGLSSSSEQLLILTNKYEAASKRIDMAAKYAVSLLENLKTNTVQQKDSTVRSRTYQSENDSVFTDNASQASSETSLSTYDDIAHLEIGASYRVLEEARQAREYSVKALAKFKDLQVSNNDSHTNTLQ